MEESKLNFNAPLLSVRRLSSTFAFSARDTQKMTVENSSSTTGHILPFDNSGVTEPVAVPFVWEQIPGKPKGVISGFENEDGVYSDAIDTLSPTDSFSMNCSMIGSVAAKPSPTLSADSQQMSLFSPAAKAMTLKTPPYALRKQSTAPPVNRYESIIIPHYEDSYNLSRRTCGLLPRLCFMSYIRLLNPVPRLKVRTRSSLSSTREVAKPGKATSSQICDKHDNWDVVCNNKSDSIVQSSLFPVPENKSDSGVQSHRLPEIGKKLSRGSNRFTSSNDLQMVHWSPPKKDPGSSRISPYRRERPQSLFSGRGLLGIPKEAEKLKANMLVTYTNSNNNCKELVPYLMTPAVEKTLYVEPASVESSLQDFIDLNLLDTKGMSENEITWSVKSSSSSFSDKPDIRGLVDQGEAKGGSDYAAPCPPPLPKTPSESWLSRALPVVTSRSSYSKSYNVTCFNPKKQEPKIPAATNTKWETIVKTSYLYHDHVCYSKERVTHLSQQT